jgi:hypothetical protein
MARAGRLFVLIGLSLGGFGCSGSVASPESGPPPNILELRAMGTTYASPFAAVLEAAFGPTATLRNFAFSVSNGDGSVSLHALLTTADLDAGAARLTVASEPLADDVANAQVLGVAGTPTLDGASVQLQFAPNAVSGTLTPLGGSAPWTLTGALSVECMVPTATLPPSEQPTGGIDGDGALSADDAFTTPDCAPLRTLAGL